MAITLKPEHEEMIAQAIRTGAYRSAEDVIGRALEVLRAEDDWLAEMKPAFSDEIGSEKIERAFEQFDRGEFFSPEQSRADMDARKAEWNRSRGH